MVRRKNNIGYKTYDTVTKANAKKKREQLQIEFQGTCIPSRRTTSAIQEIVVSGSIHQGDLKFGAGSRGRQCTANAAVAIAMCQIIELPSWNNETIDNILFHGDRLYTDSISKRRIPHGTEADREYLRVTELNRVLELFGNKFRLIIEEDTSVDGNVILEIAEFPNLRNGVNAFFNDHIYGVLTTKNISVAIFKLHGHFWLFDPHARGPSGRQAWPNSAACLIRFNDIESLYNLLACNLSLEPDNPINSNCQYSIMPLYIERLPAQNIISNLQFEVVLNNIVGYECLGGALNPRVLVKDRNHTSMVSNVPDSSIKVPDSSVKLKHRGKAVKRKKQSSIPSKYDDGQRFISTQGKLQEVIHPSDTAGMAYMATQAQSDVTDVNNVSHVNCVVKNKCLGNSSHPQCSEKYANHVSVDSNADLSVSDSLVKRNLDENAAKWKKHKSTFSTHGQGSVNILTQEKRQELEVIGLHQSDSTGIQTIVGSVEQQQLEFQAAIWKFADIACTVCNKLCYKPQTCMLIVNDITRTVLPLELQNHGRLTVCNRCGSTIKKGKCPTQAYWNAMFLDPIPDVITSLSDIEKRLISMVVPFIKIIKLGGRFGQYGFKGQAVLFAQDVEEVIEQLPLSMTSVGLAIVCEQLENVTRMREFQVHVEKLWSALVWLKENNALYRNVQIDYNNTNFDLSQICQMVRGEPEKNISHPQEDMPQASTEFIDMKHSRAILRGSFHQDDQHFSEMSRGKQCSANAAIAIVMATLVSLCCWTKDSIDTILINGDKLYRESISKHNSQHASDINYEYPAVTELQTNIALLGNICKLIIDDTECISGHLHRDNAKAGLRNLSTALNVFFENHMYGILVANGMSLAIFKMHDFFWMFDSQPCGPNGRKAQKNGVSCLIRFPSMESLLKLLKCNIPKSTDKNFGNQYSLSPVFVIVQSENHELSKNIHATYIDKGRKRKRTIAQKEANNSTTSKTIDGELSLMTSILRPTDDCIPEVDSVICGSLINDGEPINNVPLRTLQRKTAPPLQMHVERRVEELAWYYLFPNGRNGLHEPTRQLPITPLDYCQARIMCADRRFQRNDYLFYALSVMEYYRARQNIGVCLRLRQGDTRPEGLVKNLYLNMRGLRGSNAYWQTASSDLIAMVRNLGPPTWFVTLSCNDLNWKDMMKACLIAAGRRDENPDDLEWDDKMKLIEEHPITLSRQFMVRIHAIMRVLKRDSEILGGKLVDYWWRIEFQNRGSPHLHMLCWNEGVPPFESPEGIAVIDKVISCSSKPRNAALVETVQRVQVHHHTSSCYKKRSNHYCRFHFPRQTSEYTEILDADGAMRNNGRFCVLKRGIEDFNVNNYNPILLQLWGGNMDIQPCGNVIAVAYYIAKYASKIETQDVEGAVKEVIQRVQRYGGDVGKQLFAVSMAILRFRQVSAPECAFRLCHLKLKDSSRKVVFLNTCRPEERYRMLRCDQSEGEVHINMFDRYISRPYNLEEWSLAEFAVTFEHMAKFKNDDEEMGDCEIYEDENEVVSFSKVIRLLNGMRMKQRSRKAVLKTRYYTQIGDREGYFYSYLVAHVPFRNEQELIGDFENAEAAFNAKLHLLRPLQQGETVQEFQHVERELRQVMAQVLALGETDQPIQNMPDNDAVENARVEAIIEGYEPGLVDVDVEDRTDTGEEHVISPEEFAKCIRSMNVEQKQLFENITNTIRRDLCANDPTDNTLKLFVTGGAGSGKTFLLKMIVHQIKMCYAPTVDALHNACFVEVCALTGVAARLVRGRTLHNAFSLAIEKGKASAYRQLTGQRLEDLRRRWKYIRWLIIDEISMVSYEVMRSVHLRLQELKNNTLLFGGVHILVFGDIMQLPPVKGHWCFQQPEQYLAEPHLWRFFGLCELCSNMRQQNDVPFVDLLNNLRIGEITIEQYEMLLNTTRVPLVDEFADGEAVRIFPTLKLVDNYNNKMMDLLASCGKIYKINARDESREPRTYGQKPPANAVPVDPNNTGGFLSKIKLAVGCRVMLRTNIRVTEGLVNGALGVVRGFQWEALRRNQLEDGELPKKVFVQFDDPLVGSSFKEANGYVGISAVSVTYQGNKGFGNIERVMLPLILSWAVTVHKLQGTTVDKAVVYLGKKMFAKGQAYVALSRVRSMEGLVVCELDKKKLFNRPHDERALAELQRLRTICSGNL